MITQNHFYLRKNARCPTVSDQRQRFCYSVRRGLSPELASRNAYWLITSSMAKPIKKAGYLCATPTPVSSCFERDFRGKAAETSSQSRTPDLEACWSDNVEYSPRSRNQPPPPTHLFTSHAFSDPLTCRRMKNPGIKHSRRTQNEGSSGDYGVRKVPAEDMAWRLLTTTRCAFAWRNQLLSSAVVGPPSFFVRSPEND